MKFEITVNKHGDRYDFEKVSDSDLDSLKSFIDDNDKIENDRTFYQKFENVTSSIDDVFKEKYDKVLLI